MNKAVIIIICINIFMSCKSSFHYQPTHVRHYVTGWVKESFIAIDKEMSNIPNGCPSLKSRIEQFKEIVSLNDLIENEKIIDSLTNNIRLDARSSELAIVDRYIQGFNFSHCTTFMIYDENGNLKSSIRKCKRDPDPILAESTPSVLENFVDKDKYTLEDYLKMKSDCNLDGIFIVTILDNHLNIKKIKAILMPN